MDIISTVYPFTQQGYKFFGRVLMLGPSACEPVLPPQAENPDKRTISIPWGAGIFLTV